MDLAGKNRKEDAKKVLQKADKMMNESNFGYGITSRGNQHNRNSLLFLEACYMAGDTVLASKVAASVKLDLQQQIRYYKTMSTEKQETMSDERRAAESYLTGLQQMQSVYNPRIQIPGKMMSTDDSQKLAKDTSKKK